MSKSFARQVLVTIAATLVAHWIMRNVPELRPYLKDEL